MNKLYLIDSVLNHHDIDCKTLICLWLKRVLPDLLVSSVGRNDLSNDNLKTSWRIMLNNIKITIHSHHFVLIWPQYEVMGVLQWTLTSLAPSLHWEFSMSILKLNVKREPVMSIFIQGLPLFPSFGLKKMFSSWSSGLVCRRQWRKTIFNF